MLAGPGTMWEATSSVNGSGYFPPPGISGTYDAVIAHATCDCTMQGRQLMTSHLIWKVLCCDFIGILRWDLHRLITLIAVSGSVH